ncbi:MAG: DUF4129 domain-containing protein, partial [Anaerolineae bacterium]
AALLLALAGWLGWRWRRRTFFRRPELLVRLFEALGRWAERLHIPWQPSFTPLERATLFNRFVPEAQPAVGRLADLFVAERYGRRPPAADALDGLIEDWQQMEPALWRRWLNLQVARAKEWRRRT